MALQRRRLNDLLNYVVQFVPYYQRWAAESGFKIGDAISLSDMPVVSKRDYRIDPEAFQSQKVPQKQMVFGSSSGTTGEIFEFRTHPTHADYSYCCLARAMARHGIRFGDRRIFLWGTKWQFLVTSPRDALKRIRYVGRDWLRDWLNVSKSINGYDMSETNLSRAVKYIETFRPIYLHGSVSALYFVGRRLLDSGMRLPKGVPMRVFTEGEKLYKFQHETLHEAFGCPIIEHYGSNEFGNVAEVDPDGHLRINEDAYVVERSANGEAIITGLLSHAYPFIRYRLGDLIEFEDDVPPNLPYRALKSIVGRTYDTISCPNGTNVPGFVFSGALEPHHAAIDRFQFHQTAIDRIELRLVMRARLDEPRRRKILCELRSIVGDDLKIEIHVVDEIKPASSGKFRWVVSDVVNETTDEMARARTEAFSEVSSPQLG